MTKPEKLSAEAAAAVTEGDLWSLFFTQEVVPVIFCSGPYPGIYLVLPVLYIFPLTEVILVSLSLRFILTTIAGQ
jgi:hypothetical protein